MTRKLVKIAFLFAVTTAVAATPAAAQAPGATAPGGSSSSPAGDPAKATKGGDLSDKLNATNGVIRPHGDVDPGIAKPAPRDGVMPVIPPPGAPGGNENVQPK